MTPFPREFSHKLRNLKVPWLCFFILVTSNGLLSYLPQPPETRIWIGLLGFFIPFSIASFFLGRTPFKENSFRFSETISTIPILFWGLLLPLSVFLRFYRLTTFTGWPMVDESLFSYFSLEFAKTGVIQPFYFVSQVPPFYVLALGGAFNFLGGSLFTLWLVPAVFSSLTLPFVFFSTRNLFGTSFAGIFTFLWAFNFWAMAEGRFSLQYPLLVFWMWVVFYLLSVFLKTLENGGKKSRLVFLAAGTGIGFYITISWVIIAGVATVVLFWKTRQERKWFWIFCLLTFFSVLPLLQMGYSHHFGGYIQSLWTFKNGFLWKPYLLNVFHYFAGVFWGSPRHLAVMAYGPHWGGFLNPILVSFFQLGAIQIWRSPNKTRMNFFIAVFFLCFLPVFLTRNLEYFRIVQILPFLLFMVGGGVQFLAADKSFPGTRGLVAGLLLFSMSLDIFHLLGPTQKAVSEISPLAMKSRELAGAYQILEERKILQEPFILFDKFFENPADSSLWLAAYSGNSAAEPGLPVKPPRWMAVITNVNYQPFLSKIFPGSKNFWLSKNAPPPDGGLMLLLAPVTEGDKQLLTRWKKADLAWNQFRKKVLGWGPQETIGAKERDLAEVFSSLEGDPFLTSVYWGEMADLRIREALSKTFKATYGNEAWEIPSGNLALARGQEVFFDESIQALKTGLQNGYRSANLYYRLGFLYSLTQKNDLARGNFLRALKSPLNFTDAARCVK